MSASIGASSLGRAESSKTPGQESGSVQLTPGETYFFRDHGQFDLLRFRLLPEIIGRRRRERSLRQAAMVFESTRDGVMIAGFDARLQAVNKAFADITGYGEAEMRGHDPRLLRSGRHGPAIAPCCWSMTSPTFFPH